MVTSLGVYDSFLINTKSAPGCPICGKTGRSNNDIEIEFQTKDLACNCDFYRPGDYVDKSRRYLIVYDYCKRCKKMYFLKLILNKKGIWEGEWTRITVEN